MQEQLLGRYLVFDEFHLFDPDTSLGTVIEMLKMLNGITPFLLMTATFSEPLLEHLSQDLNAEVVPVTDAELQQIPSQRGKRREYQVADQALLDSTDTVINQHQERSIVICNTVARAQEIYQSLQDNLLRGATEVLLLHSRFLKEHRKTKEDTIRERFRRDAGPDNVILVATQVIEVGLDITCENLHTELAPASAIFQRAGRCARFENESGTVRIYPIKTDGSPNYAPYDKETCEATMNAFQRRNGDVLDFAAEQAVINEVHRERDENILARLEIETSSTRQSISKAISEQELALARELIRRNDSRTLLVHDDPERAFPMPFGVEGFSLYRGTLFGAWDKLQQTAQEQGLDWSLKYPVEADNSSPDSRAAIAYNWHRVENRETLGVSPLFVVHPRLVTYDNEIGFRLKAGEEPCLLSIPDDEPPQERPVSRGYYRETYTEHIGHLLNAYHSGLAAELCYAASKLEQKLGADEGALDQAIRLCIALHDVGKLTVEWQNWAHQWQRVVGRPIPENYMAAHTDYNRDDLAERERERRFPIQRPGHAVESVWAVAPLLAKVFGREQRDLAEACFTAIGRHHAPQARNCSPYTLHPTCII